MDESKTLKIDYNLNLNDIRIDNEISKDIIYSEELNSYLRKQLNSTQRENKQLKQQLLETEQKLNENQLKIDKLTKKIRDNKTITHNISIAQLNTKIQQLEKTLNEKIHELDEFKGKYENLLERSQQERKNDEFKKLQDKLNLTTNKLIETKNLNTKLKHDLQLANKWLQQEIGDNFESLQNITSSNCNWRGRAQIICDLQIKLKDLKEKLAAKTSQETVTETHSTSIVNNNLLQQENAELNQNFVELKKKFEITKTRCRVLETECNGFKMKITNLTNNLNEHKDNISQLEAQLLNQTNLNIETIKEKDKFIRNVKQELKSLRIDLAKANCLIENKSKIIEEKNEEIEMLLKKRSRPTSSYGIPQKDLQNKTISHLEVEKTKLLELIEIQNQRLINERDLNEKTQKQLRYERQKGAKLEANLARLDLELTSSSRSSLGSYCNKSHNNKNEDENNYKNQLELAEENIKALQSRLEIEIYEHESDVKEFGKILKNCNCKF